MPHANLAILILLFQTLSITTIALALHPPTIHSHHNRTRLRLPTFEPVHCIRLNGPPPPGLNPTNCEDLARKKCRSIPLIKPEHIRRSEWVWNEVEDCAIGFYFPPEAPLPKERECDEVMDNLLDRCARNSRFNAGAVNVARWPDFGQDGHGIVEGEMRWILAPWRLTL